jgi:hypothetical protein
MVECVDAAHAASDPFSFLDQNRPSMPHTAKTGRETHDRLLLNAVITRVNRLNLLDDGEGDLWAIDLGQPGQLSLPALKAALIVRVGMAAELGTDLRQTFEVDDSAVHSQATHLADVLHDARSGAAMVSTLPGYEDLIAVIGLPGIDVANVARWFRGTLRRFERQLADYFGYLLSDIGSSASPIVSNAALDSRQRQLDRQKDYAERHCFVCVDANGGETRVKFGDAQNNAARRSAKIYARLKGLEQFCGSRGLDGYFVTLTLPPRFHPNPANGNSTWNGATPSQGHAELQRRWRSIQRRVGESGGKCFGVRVEEPHEDGCPHWHALIFVAPERESILRKCIARVFGGDLAAQVERIDRSRGSGASYLLKYISPILLDRKAETPLLEEGVSQTKKTEKSALYDAHRATWGARSIQFFDLPGSSTVWDEVRRIKDGSIEYALLGLDGKRLHAAAIQTKYGDFLEVLVNLRESSPPRLTVAYGVRGKRNRAVVGIEIDGNLIQTRTKQWTVEPVKPVAKRPAARPDS